MQFHWIAMGDTEASDVERKLPTLPWATVLLDWRNDPATRRASHNSNCIHRDDHFCWLAKTLGTPTSRMVIAKIDSLPIGTVRADYEAGLWRLSWTVAPEARGRGLGRLMVGHAAFALSGPILAEIKADNRASVRIAEHVGMSLTEVAEGICYYSSSGLLVPQTLGVNARKCRG